MTYDDWKTTDEIGDQLAADEERERREDEDNALRLCATCRCAEVRAGDECMVCEARA